MLAAGHLKFKIQTTENVGNGLGGQGSFHYKDDILHYHSLSYEPTSLVH